MGGWAGGRSVLQERNGGWGGRVGGLPAEAACAATRCLVVCWRGSNNNAYIQNTASLHDTLLCQSHSLGLFRLASCRLAANFACSAAHWSVSGAHVFPPRPREAGGAPAATWEPVCGGGGCAGPPAVAPAYRKHQTRYEPQPLRAQACARSTLAPSRACGA